VRGSLTSSVFGDFEVSAVTLKFVPPSASVVVNTLGAFLVMFLAIPPAVRRVAPSLVGVKVWMRESSESHCLQALGFLSVGTTRNSIVVPCANAVADTIAARRTASIDPAGVLVALRIFGSLGESSGYWTGNCSWRRAASFRHTKREQQR
jgi:hypothetical protein